MILKKANNKRIRIQSARRWFLEYSKYLKPGRYVLFPNMRVLALEDKDNIQCVVNKLGYHRAASTVEKLMTWFGRCVLREKKHNDLNFYGSILYINNNYPNPIRMKVFDLENDTVLVLYRDENKYWEERERQKKLIDFFGLPQIITEKANELAYVEQMIDSVSREHYTEAEKCQLFEKVSIKYIKFTKEFVKSERNFLFSDTSCFYLEDKCDKELHLVYPMMPQHNDLSTLNIIVDTCAEVHIIDWEHYGNNIFYYDLFRWIINDFQRENEDSLLKAFITGKFDSVISDLFAVFKMDYCSEMRVSYLETVFRRMIQFCRENGISQDVLEDMICEYKRKIEELSDNDD